MCTDRTLSKHVDRWHELKAEKARIEAELAKESDYIMAELDDRKIEKFLTVRITCRHDERPSKSIILEQYPGIWDAVKTVSDSRFLRKCRA